MGMGRQKDHKFEVTVHMGSVPGEGHLCLKYITPHLTQATQELRGMCVAAQQKGPQDSFKAIYCLKLAT